MLIDGAHCYFSRTNAKRKIWCTLHTAISMYGQKSHTTPFLTWPQKDAGRDFDATNALNCDECPRIIPIFDPTTLLFTRKINSSTMGNYDFYADLIRPTRSGRRSVGKGGFLGRIKSYRAHCGVQCISRMLGRRNRGISYYAPILTLLTMAINNFL